MIVAALMLPEVTAGITEASATRSPGTPCTLRAFFEQLAHEAGYALAWQHLDAARNIEASAAIMRGDVEPMRKMLDTLVTDEN